jgi:tubulin--tyrosine ligase
MPSEELVKLFWELERLDALLLPAHWGGRYESGVKVGKEWLEGTFERVGEVVAESLKAGVECGSCGLQLVPNAFEVRQIETPWRSAQIRER